MFVFTGCDNNSHNDSDKSREEEISDDEGKIIGIDKYKDILQDDISHEEEEQEPLSIREKINTNVSEGAYNELTHKFSLYDFDGFKICQLSLPPSCEIVFEADEKTSFTIMVKTRDYYTLWISQYVVEGEDKYILYGTVPDENYYQDYECEYELIEKDELTLYKVHSSYTFNDKQYDNYKIMVPYYNLDGNEKFIEIKLEDKFYNDWDDGLDKVIYSLFINSFNGNGDSLLEHQDIYPLVTDDMELYNEETGEFTLYSDAGYPLETFSVPKGFSMHNYYDDGSYYVLISDDLYDYERLTIRIYNKTDIKLVDYLIDGKTEVTEGDKLVRLSAKQDKIGDYNCFIVDYAYGRIVTNKHQVLVEYSTYLGDEDFIAIDMPEEMINDWDNGTREIVKDMLKK